MPYDADYFIAKFEAIPDELWITGAFFDTQGRKCALGHCGARNYCEETEESEALMQILIEPGLWAEAVNDGNYQMYQQPTPKARILAALRDAKERQESQQS